MRLELAQGLRQGEGDCPERSQQLQPSEGKVFLRHCQLGGPQTRPKEAQSGSDR